MQTVAEALRKSTPWLDGGDMPHALPLRRITLKHFEKA
jgi:hypothetical protein